MPEAESVKAVVEELKKLCEKDKDTNIKFHTPKTDERLMFGTEVTQCHDIRDAFENKVHNPFSLRTREEGADIEEMKKLVIRILNRVSEKNYDALAQELLQSNLDQICQDPAILKDVVAMFFSKAVNEKIWANVYGRLCKDICQHWAQATDSPSSATPAGTEQTFCSKFRRQLLNQCQEEFERGIKLQKELLLLPADEREIQEAKLRMRTLANMKFVGELYKHNLITERIMHQVMFSLLFPGTASEKLTDEGLELFCELMDTVGKQLDRPKAQQYMSQYFQQVTVLSTSYKTARVRFKLQNLLDLRKSGWVRDESGSGPSTPVTTAPQDNKGSGRADTREPAQVRMKVMPRPPAPTTQSANAYQPPSKQAPTVHRDPVPAPAPVQPVAPRPAAQEPPKPTTHTMKTFSKSEWEEKVNIMFEEDAGDTVDVLKLYDSESRELFFFKSIQILCGSVQRYFNPRSRFGNIVTECFKAKVFDSATLDKVISDSAKQWVETDAIADMPRLWDCWAELVVSGVQAEVMTEGVLNRVLDRLLSADGGPDPDAIVLYVRSVHSILSKSGVASGGTSYFRTMNAAKYPEVLKALLSLVSSGGTEEPKEPGLRTLEMLQAKGQVVLDEAKDLTAVARTAGVLCTQAFIEVREPQDIGRVFKKLSTHFTRVADSRNVKERATKEAAILAEAQLSCKLMGKTEAHLTEFINLLQSNHTVSLESTKLARQGAPGRLIDAPAK
jgi:hypothetical protein